jgi:hypothetical protein
MIVNANEEKLFTLSDSIRKNKMGTLQIRMDFLKLKMSLQGTSAILS